MFLPVIATNLLESIDRARQRVSQSSPTSCVRGIEPNVDTLRQYAEASPAIGTALTPYLGYETTAEIVKESTRTGKSIRADRQGARS